MDATEQKKVIKEIEEKIQATCTESKYTHLCQRITTEAGLAWAVNRCVKAMADDKIHLSAALAYLESELEGVS